MKDFYYVHHDFVVFDAVDNAVSPLANPVAFPPGEFSRAGLPGIVLQAMYPFDNALAILFIDDGPQFFRGRGLDEKPILHHCASGL